MKSAKGKSLTVSFPGGGCFAPFRARWGRVRGAGLNAWMKLGNPAGSWDFWRAPGPAPGPGRGGPGKSRLFHFFPRNPSAAEVFPGISWKSARNLAGPDPRGTFSATPGSFPGGKSPEFRSAPGIPLDFFYFFESRALFRPVGPRCTPFPGKVRDKTRDSDRIRLSKAPKGKV